MRTLLLTDVPDEVVSWLEQLAVATGMSVEIVAGRELANPLRRLDNAGLLAGLPDQPVDISELLADRDTHRGGH